MSYLIIHPLPHPHPQQSINAALPHQKSPLNRPFLLLQEKCLLNVQIFLENPGLFINSLLQAYRTCYIHTAWIISSADILVKYPLSNKKKFFRHHSGIQGEHLIAISAVAMTLHSTHNSQRDPQILVTGY